MRRKGNAVLTFNQTGGGRKKEKVTHSDICRATGKIGAYLRLGNKEDAGKWAVKLVGYLHSLNLLPVREEDDLPR